MTLLTHDSKITRLVAGIFLFISFPLTLVAADLERDFRNPPEETKPWCYWYWLHQDITKDGITKDLESMARVGIKRAMIGNIGGKKHNLGKMNIGNVQMFSDEWYALTRHAMKEGERVGVDIYMFNSPGWSQSGGPWIKPEQSMRRVTWSEFTSDGGPFSQKVRPAGIDASQDIAVLAVPQLDSVSIIGSAGSQKSGDEALHFTHTEPFTARSLIVHGKAKGRLYALIGGQRELVADINANGGRSMDFLPNEIETFSFADVTASEFEFVPAVECKVVLTSAPKVAQVIEKQMGRLHPTPAPAWESYIFPDTVEPGNKSTVISRKDIINLTDKLGADGVLKCKLPKGKWDVIYFGMVTTGKKNGPAPEDGTGLEVDKMSRKHTQYHFNSMFGKLLSKLTPQERKAFKGITIDSYEKGAQNWTDGFAAEFEKRNGYSPTLLLPVMTGRVLDSAKTSDRFLWDLRRTVANMIATEYVGGLRDIAHEHGLTLWCENYGHWGFPSEFLIYGGYSDEVSGEFWTTSTWDLGDIECRAASSSGHIYGKRRVYAEAFTGPFRPEKHPYTFKARGEQMFCQGINHFVFHVYAHQPKDGVPGRNPRFGTPFHRNTPWFNESRDFVKYLQRCHYMLQQGNPAADVAVYIGDFAPQMTGPANPVAAGYDYDYMGSDAILRKLNVVDGEWVVYDEYNPKRIAGRWKVLAMPKVKYVRPKVLKRIDELEKKGGKVIDGVPVNAAALQKAGIAPIVSDTSCSIHWKARELDDAMLFFLSNFSKTGTFEATLRIEGKAPELFNPVTGEITKLARYRDVENGTRITINVNDRSDSFFVVFRDKPSGLSVVSASAPPAVLKLSYDNKGRLLAESEKAGTYTCSMSDSTKRQVVIEKDSQVLAIKGTWKETGKSNGNYSVEQETRFKVPAGFGKNQRVTLDLGEVEVMAKVTLNGKTFDTLWMPPFELDVTDVFKEGENILKVLVTSTAKNEPSLGKVEQMKTATQKVVSE